MKIFSVVKSLQKKKNNNIIAYVKIINCFVNLTLISNFYFIYLFYLTLILII